MHRYRLVTLVVALPLDARGMPVFAERDTLPLVRHTIGFAPPGSIGVCVRKVKDVVADDASPVDAARNADD